MAGVALDMLVHPRHAHAQTLMSDRNAPQVEDLEAALQEAALGSVHDVLLAPAAAAKTLKAGAVSAMEAAQRLHVMLGCLAGRAQPHDHEHENPQPHAESLDYLNIFPTDECHVSSCPPSFPVRPSA